MNKLKFLQKINKLKKKKIINYYDFVLYIKNNAN